MPDFEVLVSSVLVTPDYISIAATADICKPWIDLWSGDEWGYSMQNLHGACHTDYGFSNEDCALFAFKLIENLQIQWIWMLEEGHNYGFMCPENLEATRIETKKRRDYWLAGGNLGDWGPVKAQAKRTIDTMPEWLFIRQDFESNLTSLSHVEQN